MKWIFLLIVLAHGVSYGQTYTDSVFQFRQQYKGDFITDPHSPLRAADTGNLRFYAPNKKFDILATFKESPNSVPFNMPTHSGKLKEYREFGTATFIVNRRHFTLHIYQSINQANVYLFLPFTDLTNYQETFGGGRYLDLNLNDFKDGHIRLDFNKCYNPYCAYADGYSCPIPPKENALDLEIRAGEKLFAKK